MPQFDASRRQRPRGGVEPTPFGDALVDRSRALIDDLQSALRELATGPTPRSAR